MTPEQEEELATLMLLKPLEVIIEGIQGGHTEGIPDSRMSRELVPLLEELVEEEPVQVATLLFMYLSTYKLGQDAVSAEASRLRWLGRRMN